MPHVRSSVARRSRTQEIIWRLQHLWQTWILEFILRQYPLPPSKDGRHIPISPSQTPLIDERRSRPYIPNTVHSSRYSIWDFLPRQLWFQCTRLHNVFFIIIGVPQCISGLSTTGNFTTILPLLVFMCLTIVKEGFDDYRRNRMDQAENKSLATVLRNVGAKANVSTYSLSESLTKWITWSRSTLDIAEGGLEHERDHDWHSTQWRSLNVGDILLLRRDEQLPADVVLLSTSDEDGICYIETMNLDGETNLKYRQAPACLSQAYSTIDGIRRSDAVIVAQDPSPALHSFDGRVTTNGFNYPLTLDNTILRGCVLRNTSHAIALVVRTGEECSIRMNANHHAAAKKPRLEKFANQVVVTLIIYVIIITAGLSIGYMLWQHRYEQSAPYLTDAAVGYQEVIIGYGIMFNNVIPLALYISLEIVRVGQMLLLNSDLDLYDAETDTPMVCNTNTILENLGQVTHVLSDKTGTLTENVMRVKQLSFAGSRFVYEPARAAAADAKETSSSVSTAKDDKSFNDITPPFIRVIERQDSSASNLHISSLAAHPHTIPDVGTLRQVNPSDKDAITELHKNPTLCIFQVTRQLLLAMALCHTCLPEMRHENSPSSIEYQGASPDELALVRAAHDLGFSMVERSSTSITLSIQIEQGCKKREEYQILDSIGFSSSRKRMSIIVRCPDGRIWLICKGADNMLIPLLKQEVRENTLQEDALLGECSSEPYHTIPAGRCRTDSAITTDAKRDGKVEQSQIHITRLDSTDHSITPSDIPLTPLVPYAIPSNPRHGDPKALSLQHSSSPKDAATHLDRCLQDIDLYANTGLRTLLFTHRTLTNREYEIWHAQYNEASTALVDREARVDLAGALIERDLELLGVAAIEDKLQEGVPETIEQLSKVCKVFCLTGDKRETAISIAHAARICRPDSRVVIIDRVQGDIGYQVETLLFDYNTVTRHTVLVIDGETLAIIETDTNLRTTFYALVAKVDSVICCRASPAQKANIVQGIRDTTPDALTLAIGDGANDIAMIQAAHVGIGISGKEGLQAYRAADYSIARFHHLSKLLLIHGRYNYMRISKFILWTFWKEMMFYLPQAIFQHYNGYTGSSLYESWSLTALNTLFTSLCVIVPGIFEQDLNKRMLLDYPELYAYGQRNAGLNLRVYLWWMIDATIAGLAIWFLAWAGYGGKEHGQGEMFALGDLCFSAAIIWTNVKLLLFHTHYRTIIVGVAFVITFGGWWLWNLFLNFAFSADNRWPYNVTDGFIGHFGKDPCWWLTLILIIGVLSVLEVLPFVFRQIGGQGLPTRLGRLVPCPWQGFVADDVFLDVKRWQRFQSGQMGSQPLSDSSDRSEKAIDDG